MMTGGIRRLFPAGIEGRLEPDLIAFAKLVLDKKRAQDLKTGSGGGKRLNGPARRINGLGLTDDGDGNFNPNGPVDDGIG
jgi:hypothetical protein